MDFSIIIKDFIEHYGLLSVFIVVMLEYANFPLPSELVLPFVGLMIANGDINFTLALIVSVIGGIIGCITNYLIGLYFGKPVLKYMISKYPKTKKSINSSMWWMNKYGKLSVMLARVVPLARTVISIPAGMNKMNISVFVFYSSIGISIWNFILIYLGYVLGDNLSKIGYLIENYSLILLIVGVLIIVYMMIKNRKLNYTYSQRSNDKKYK